ncbi:MAG: zinc ribbon domain-containing protein [Prevotellaceae bacterium]|jgi:hypothetical protein|nr:zinc ribbon domain-containing protein [Prevotellaceae bacterium]
METTKCPFCGEEILATAKKCKHCKSWIVESSTPTQPVKTESNTRPPKKRWKKMGCAIIGGIFIGIIALAGFSLWLVSTGKVECEISYIDSLSNKISPAIIAQAVNTGDNGFRIHLHSTYENDIKITLQESKLNYETNTIVKGLEGDKEIIPTIKWKHDNLKRLMQSEHVDMTFIFYNTFDNQEIGSQTVTLLYTAPQIEFDIILDPALQQIIYPSLILGIKELSRQTGDNISFFTINLSSETENNIKIVIPETKLNYETIITEKDFIGSKEIEANILWKFDTLKTITQPEYIDMSFIAYNGISGEEIDRKTLNLQCRSTNECLIAIQTEEEIVPLQFLFASYINEDSPVVDRFLRDVIRSYPDVQFVGYQLGADWVDIQVAAIFLTMRQKGIKYSNITTTSNTNSNVATQYIRFCDEVLSNTQANCADGTVFFCSILRKLGIHSCMVFVPGHVFLGYYRDEGKRNLRLLETTAVGNTDYNFIEASDMQVAAYNANRNKLSDDNILDGYFMIDVDDMRKVIKPIGR